ncbi:MAG: hypothetical protein GY714_27255, partial [Desulfobacterales bacterium]|nr:hypothetical protein [Desulfobacterales bacterium]
MRSMVLRFLVVLFFSLPVFAFAEEINPYFEKDCTVGSWHLYFSGHKIYVDEPGDALLKITKSDNASFYGGFVFINMKLIPLRNFLRSAD